MDDILKLAKDYSKKRHLDLLPRGNDNILEKLDYIYDENWENQGVPYPYEILTYLFDSYRPCGQIELQEFTRYFLRVWWNIIRTDQ